MIAALCVRPLVQAVKRERGEREAGELGDRERER